PALALAPSPSPTSLLRVPASPSVPLGQYDEYRRPINAYSIDSVPVSSARYEACVAAGRCTPPSCRSTSAGDRVTCVDLAQASEYCAFEGGRLPTEEEWEHAARQAASLGMRGTDDAAEWTSIPYCYFCNRDDEVVRGGPARNPALRGWRAPGAREADVGFRCAHTS
ncbi:MAG: formylglycine-generating enzyme family protein, partial [Polyangiaceae bacterium]